MEGEENRDGKKEIGKREEKDGKRGGKFEGKRKGRID